MSEVQSPWQVRCSAEQKRHFQNAVSESGLNASEFLERAVQAMRVSESENDEIKSVYAEADGLLSRLQALIRAQIGIALEKQQQFEEKQKNALLREEEASGYYDELKTKLEAEHETRKLELEASAKQEVETFSKQSTAELEKKNRENIFLQERLEKLDLELSQLQQDKSAIQRQYTDSMRLYEIADDRLMEAKKTIMMQEDKLKNYESLKDRCIFLEKEVAVLQVKNDSVIREEALKREYLEKELRLELSNKNDNNIQ